jgi:hypothetical protein
MMFAVFVIEDWVEIGGFLEDWVVDLHPVLTQDDVHPPKIHDVKDDEFNMAAKTNLQLGSTGDPLKKATICTTRTVRVLMVSLLDGVLVSHFRCDVTDIGTSVEKYRGGSQMDVFRVAVDIHGHCIILVNAGVDIEDGSKGPFSNDEIDWDGFLVIGVDLSRWRAQGGAMIRLAAADAQSVVSTILGDARMVLQPSIAIDLVQDASWSTSWFHTGI